MQKMLSALNVPGGFDVAQISWRPDYDPFFYWQLSRRARRVYLLRDEYIFDLQKAVVHPLLRVVAVNDSAQTRPL